MGIKEFDFLEKLKVEVMIKNLVNKWSPPPSDGK